MSEFNPNFPSIIIIFITQNYKFNSNHIYLLYIYSQIIIFSFFQLFHDLVFITQLYSRFPWFYLLFIELSHLLTNLNNCSTKLSCLFYLNKIKIKKNKIFLKWHLKHNFRIKRMLSLTLWLNFSICFEFLCLWSSCNAFQLLVELTIIYIVFFDSQLSHRFYPTNDDESDWGGLLS